MKSLPQPLQQLIDSLSRLPGIGRKTATRLAFHIMNTDPGESEALSTAIKRVRSEIRTCVRCFNFSEQELCSICRDPNRQSRIVCVVEDPQNILMVEKTNEYRGLYHVLGGVISPLEGIGPEDLRVKELLQRIENEEIEEIIIALNPSTEGEATSIYLARLLKPQSIQVTRLARGIPLGSSLEYVDELTLGKALQARNKM
ncbi:MAG: recombination mediator RecR [Calditrichota bacterium]